MRNRIATLLHVVLAVAVFVASAGVVLAEPANDQQANDQQANDQQANDQQANDQQANDQQANDQQANDQQANDRSAEQPPLGTTIDEFVLPLAGNAETAVGVEKWSLAINGRGAKAIVVVFIGTECPVSNAYLPTLVGLSNEYRERGVVFVGVNSNAHDSSDAITRHTNEYAISFPVLIDADARVAWRFCATRLATAFVLDATRTVRYRGRIDDQFERGVKRAKPSNFELRDALDSVLAGREVTRPLTDVVACPINRADKEVNAKSTTADGMTGGKESVSYARQISRIMQKKCQECHRSGEVGPFSLATFNDAVAWSGAIREVVAEGIMPPWTADPKHGNFANDRRLSDDERTTLLAWIDDGCLEGDAAEMPPTRKFVQGWNIGEPDEIIVMNTKMEVPAQAPTGGIPYKFVKAGKPFTEDRWVRAAEVRPGNRGVVHHIIVYAVRPGQRTPMASGGLNDLIAAVGGSDRKSEPDVLLAFVPGDQAFVLPDGMARRVPKGTQLIFELHYTPNGKAAVDESMIGLKYADGPAAIEVKGDVVLNFNFTIPPNAPNHRVAESFKFERDVMLMSMNPHMHVRGKSFEYRLFYPDGSEEILLSVPKYDFNWQFTYTLTEPKRVPKGSKLVCTAHYDNSPGNPGNPDPSKNVRWGDQTWEEMMIGFFEYYDAPPSGESDE